MKNCILSAIAGALCMYAFMRFLPAAELSTEIRKEAYEHTDFVSETEQKNCILCADVSSPFSFHWGEDNVGLVNLNTFQLIRIEVNRYDDQKRLRTDPTGYMQTCHINDEVSGSHAYACVYPDRGFSTVQISGAQYFIDSESIRNRLCQACLDTINSLWFSGQPPAEYAIVSFEERTIQPLLSSHPLFFAGNYGIDCDFKNNGSIDLFIFYCPFRYEERQTCN